MHFSFQFPVSSLQVKVGSGILTTWNLQLSKISVQSVSISANQCASLFLFSEIVKWKKYNQKLRKKEKINKRVEKRQRRDKAEK